MEAHINYITLGVADLARSRRFYGEVFGWTETADSNEHIAFLQTGSALMLAHFGREALARDAAVDELFQAFSTRKVNIVKAPQPVFWGGYSGYIADPDGFLWEIAFNPFLKKLR